MCVFEFSLLMVCESDKNLLENKKFLWVIIVEERRLIDWKKSETVKNYDVLKCLEKIVTIDGKNSSYPFLILHYNLKRSTWS